MENKKYILRAFPDNVAGWCFTDAWDDDILTEHVNIYGNRQYLEHVSDAFNAARDLVDAYAGGGADTALVMVLDALTGHEWRAVTLRGNCQSEWQYAYVDDTYTDDDVQRLAAEYFGAGEWFDVVDDDGSDVETVFLSDGYNAETYAAECQRRYGYTVGAVEFFDGYERRAKYRTVCV